MRMRCTMSAHNRRGIRGISRGFTLVEILIVVIILLMLLLSLVVDIQSSVASLLVTAGAVASHTVNIPKLSLTPPVLNLIIEEAIIQDGYMNALTDGYGGQS